MKKNQNQEAVQTSEVAISPVTEIKIKQTAPLDRMYQLVNQPSLPPKGKQRQIVINALAQDKDRAFSVEEVTKFADAAGLKANAGTKASCSWHLHHLALLGIAKVVNPTYEVEVPKKVTPASVETVEVTA